MFAQIANAQVFRIKGGINIANMSFPSNGISISPKSIIEFHLGPVAEFEIQENIYFNTGLLYSLKGFKFKMSYMGESMESTENINYLEVPLNFAYKQSLDEKYKIFGQVGPYLGYALSGKDKTDGETTDFEFGDGGMKRFDFGLGIGAGVEFGNMLAGLNYQFGLANLSDDQDSTVKNKVLQISVTYIFSK
ncbi:MAG TPA: porin family protein [Prolixibacteraceae bacterium]|nr:porin family protein [Prolixibacteraceae bacterium]